MVAQLTPQLVLGSGDSETATPLCAHMDKAVLIVYMGVDAVPLAKTGACVSIDSVQVTQGQLRRTE